jgi:hypothetical protein
MVEGNRSSDSIGTSFPKWEAHPFPDEPFRLTTITLSFRSMSSEVDNLTDRANTIDKLGQAFLELKVKISYFK